MKRSAILLLVSVLFAGIFAGPSSARADVAQFVFKPGTDFFNWGGGAAFTYSDTDTTHSSWLPGDSNSTLVSALAASSAANLRLGYFAMVLPTVNTPSGVTDALSAWGQDVLTTSTYTPVLSAPDGWSTAATWKSDGSTKYWLVEWEANDLTPLTSKPVGPFSNSGSQFGLAFESVNPITVGSNYGLHYSGFNQAGIYPGGIDFNTFTLGPVTTTVDPINSTYEGRFYSEAVPEPGSFVLFGLGGCALLLRRLRKKKE